MHEIVHLICSLHRYFVRLHAASVAVEIGELEVFKCEPRVGQIGHFRVFVQNRSYQNELDLHENQPEADLIFIRMVSHIDSLSDKSKRRLKNDSLITT